MSDITVTLPIGPGFNVTDLLLQNLANVEFDILAKVLRIKQTSGKITEFDFNAAQGVTYTIDGDESSIVVSNEALPSGESLLHQALVTLDNDQIIHLQEAFQEIVPAPGADKVLIFQGGTLIPTGSVVGVWDTSYTNASGDFPASAFYIAYGDDLEFASTPNDFSGFRGGNKYIPLRPYGTTIDSSPNVGLLLAQQLDFSNVANAPLKLVCYNTAGNFTGGNANNVLQINILYLVYNLITGEFE